MGEKVLAMSWEPLQSSTCLRKKINSLPTETRAGHHPSLCRARSVVGVGSAASVKGRESRKADSLWFTALDLTGIGVWQEPLELCIPNSTISVLIKLSPF